jgi:Fe-S-cluster containining protein
VSLPDEDDLPDAFDGPAAPPAGEFASDVPLDDAARNRCIQCGNSCRSVYLWQGDLAFFKENDTKKWVEFHEIETFTSRLPDGRLFWGVKIPKACKFLATDEAGKAICAIYDRRPYVCRIYRGINPDGPQPGCGFNVPEPPS